MTRRQLTDEERAEAERLSTAWTRYKAENKGATQAWLAEEAGVGTQGAIAQYLRGIIPLNLPVLLSVCRVLGVNPAEISPRLSVSFDPSVHVRDASVVRLPRRENESIIDPHRPLNDIFAGAWLETRMLNPSSLLVVFAPDDSMSPRIRQGDTILVDTGKRTVEQGSVVALDNQDAVVIRRVFTRLDGNVTVHPDNAAFPDEIASPEVLRVLGRVVGLVGTDT